MSIHDGIPFIKLTFTNDIVDYINPSQISSIHGLDEKTCKERKVKFPGLKIFFNNGKEQTIGAMSADDLVKLINETMTSYKDKLADKVLLSE